MPVRTEEIELWLMSVSFVVEQQGKKRLERKKNHHLMSIFHLFNQALNVFLYKI